MRLNFYMHAYEAGSTGASMGSVFGGTLALWIAQLQWKWKWCPIHQTRQRWYQPPEPGERQCAHQVSLPFAHETNVGASPILIWSTIYPSIYLSVCRSIYLSFLLYRYRKIHTFMLICLCSQLSITLSSCLLTHSFPPSFIRLFTHSYVLVCLFANFHFLISHSFVYLFTSLFVACSLYHVTIYSFICSYCICLEAYSHGKLRASRPGRFQGYGDPGAASMLDCLCSQERLFREPQATTWGSDKTHFKQKAGDSRLKCIEDWSFVALLGSGVLREMGT